MTIRRLFTKAGHLGPQPASSSVATFTVFMSERPEPWISVRSDVLFIFNMVLAMYFVVGQFVSVGNFVIGVHLIFRIFCLLFLVTRYACDVDQSVNI